MRKYILLLVLASLLAACSKEDPIPTAGTVTIDSQSMGDPVYYKIGFTFATATLTRSTSTPKPDITVFASPDLWGNYTGAYFAADTFHPSFSLYGDYTSPSESQTAFSALLEVPAGAVWTDLADDLAINQIWIIRTADEKYAKIRIVTLEGKTSATQVYAECKFDWVFQPDGTTIFPL